MIEVMISCLNMFVINGFEGIYTHIPCLSFFILPETLLLFEDEILFVIATWFMLGFKDLLL